MPLNNAELRDLGAILQACRAGASDAVLRHLAVLSEDELLVFADKAHEFLEGRKAAAELFVAASQRGEVIDLASRRRRHDRGRSHCITVERISTGERGSGSIVRCDTEAEARAHADAVIRRSPTSHDFRVVDVMQDHD